MPDGDCDERRLGDDLPCSARTPEPRGRSTKTFPCGVAGASQGSRKSDGGRRASVRSLLYVEKRSIRASLLDILNSLVW